MTFRRQIVPFLMILTMTAQLACINRRNSSLIPLEISPYFGMEGLVQLNDTEDQMMGRSATRPERDTVTQPELVEMKFTHSWFYSDHGVRAYIRAGRVGLIEIQEPFQGHFTGKKTPLFPLSPPPGKSWEEALIREFGYPIQLMGGGRLSSSALFYSWGDVAFNGSGPNQVAIYRDERIQSYRQKNFGRVLTLFPSK